MVEKIIQPSKGFIKEFKEFALKGNMLDLAIGIILGAAFGTIVKSLVDDVIMPPIGLLLGNLDFSNLFIVLRQPENITGKLLSPESAKSVGAVTLNYGRFINNIVTFVIVAFSVFMVVKVLNSLKRKEEAAVEEVTTKECPYCCSQVAIKATKCPHCTSNL
jgi:large conductance mechanosensitive channel